MDHCLPDIFLDSVRRLSAGSRSPSAIPDAVRSQCSIRRIDWLSPPCRESDNRVGNVRVTWQVAEGPLDLSFPVKQTCATVYPGHMYSNQADVTTLEPPPSIFPATTQLQKMCTTGLDVESERLSLSCLGVPKTSL